MPKRIIPWTAIIIGVLLTIDLGHSLLENLQVRSTVNNRINELNAQITEVKTKSEAIPETITVVTAVKREVPEPPVAAMKKEPSEPMGGSAPQEAKPMAAPPPPPRTYMQLEKKQVPNPERAKAEKELRDTVVEIEAEGFKFKMINEATWNMVFKICFLWAFVLGTLGLYRRYGHA